MRTLLIYFKHRISLRAKGGQDAGGGGLGRTDNVIWHPCNAHRTGLADNDRKLIAAEAARSKHSLIGGNTVSNMRTIFATLGNRNDVI